MSSLVGADSKKLRPHNPVKAGPVEIVEGVVKLTSNSAHNQDRVPLTVQHRTKTCF